MMTGRAGRSRIVTAQQCVLLGGVAVTTAASWTYLAASRHAVHLMRASPPDPGAAVAMWAAMTLGMMLPAATPMVFMYAHISGRDRRRHAERVFAFVAAYLALWVGGSAAFALAQQWLASAELLSHMGSITRPMLSAALLIACGAYQFSSVKDACLRRCRTPMAFLLTEWRPGTAGAVKLGLLHGRDCILCCWALMLLMFVLGTMNLLWMAALTVLMLAEKTFPAGHTIGRLSGAAFVAWGLAILVRGF